jgi:hypothetical protein
VAFSNFPNDASEPPERVKAAARPFASAGLEWKKGAAAAKAFGVVAAEGDSVPADEIALALKRLAEHVAGTDKTLQVPAVRLVRKEWQHMSKWGSPRDRNGFLFGFLLAQDGLVSPYGRSLVARMRQTLEAEYNLCREMTGASSTTASSGFETLSGELAADLPATASSFFYTPTVPSLFEDFETFENFEREDSHESNSSSTSSDLRRLGGIV